ncbi:FadR/GntR family transcriptional regulator [Dactylosporangium sp. CA-233914]|uniref:FadR/GntR family transcriptional regulator n=1 Tax=Dactylosporangium sp. CA-233914 TaxID=3239934 RepID=UPI003D8FFF1A
MPAYEDRAEGDASLSGEPFQLTPIRKVDVFRSILSQLEALANQHSAGEKIGSERELAERLSVSRVSIREALRALEGMGKVRIQPNRGVFVAEHPRYVVEVAHPTGHMDENYVRQLAQVRSAIECEVVRAVAHRADPDLDAADAALREPPTGSSRASGVNLDVRFEVALGRETGNPVLIEFQRVIHELWLQAWIQRGGGVGPRDRFHDEHLRILEALRARDAEGAVRLMALHIDPYHQKSS